MNAGSLDDLLRAYSANRLQLEAEGIYYLREIDDDAAERFSRSVLLMASAREGRPDAPITVYINSPGGSVGAGFAMMEIAHRVQHGHKVPINTVITGFAYSMAAVLTQIGARRSMGSMAMMMIHSSSWSLSGEDSRIFRDYQKLAGISHTTARQDLAELVAAGLIRRHGSARSCRYSLAARQLPGNTSRSYSAAIR